MLIEQIPYHLRNTLTTLRLPIYMELAGDTLRLPPQLALGDLLMALGVVRNAGRPLRLALSSPYAQLAETYPLVKELLAPEPMEAIALSTLPVARSGRSRWWSSSVTYQLKLGVVPVDMIRATPTLAHSLYYRLARTDDRPSVFVESSAAGLLKELLPRARATVVFFPFNPGRTMHYWHDPSWWTELARRLKKDYFLVAVGADDYGELAEEVDVALPKTDPASTLPALAWALARAEGFVGCDGGISQLAIAAGCKRVVVVWDSMASYRFWASASASHILLSNPYTFRYPQTRRLTPREIDAHFRCLRLPGPENREIMLPPGPVEEAAAAVAGSYEAYVRMVLGVLEVEEERACIRQWLAQAGTRQSVYEATWAFALKALTSPTPATWVVKSFP